MTNTELKKLPSVDSLLKQLPLTNLITSYSHNFVVDVVRTELATLRTQILTQQISAPALDEIIATVVKQVQAIINPTLQPVINATGVIVHTNLGRALLSERAKEAMLTAAESYSNLEYMLSEGYRGSRYHHAEALLCRLSGAEAAVVVNNNAAALVLCLSVLAREKEVLISRSQLVEIGGGFRIPDIMTESGARLVEVGATNRTYVRDYEENLHVVNTGLILRVHHSNFKIVGFTTEPSLAELVGLGERYGIPVMDDLGSGTLLDTVQFGLAHEPTIQESVAAGVGVVTASGDKLLGGPQAGLIMGKADIIKKIKKHPLIRAFRVDKTTLAALQATLLAYLEDKAVLEIPVWQMIGADIESLDKRANMWKKDLEQVLAESKMTMRIIDAFSTVGGGSLPGQQLPTRALAIYSQKPNQLAAQLREAVLPIIGRVEAEQLILDPRTVLPEQDTALLKGIKDAII